VIPRLYKVLEKNRDALDTFTLVASSVDGEQFRCEPGQFNMLYLFGNGEIPISVSGPSNGGDTVIHTIQAVGAVSKSFTELSPGETFGLRGPFGRGWPVEKARGRDLLLMAGGLGLAPLRPVIYRVLRNREQFGRVVILYGARNRERLLFEEELKEWENSPDLELLVTLDVADSEWRGPVGVITNLIRPASTLCDLKSAAAFICGPPIMMRFSLKELLPTGIRADSVFLSLERNMKCALGFCGHCQYGPYFLCKDGPVLSFEELRPWFGVREI
jgi:NAD(P)H-flavin reductase